MWWWWWWCGDVVVGGGVGLRRRRGLPMPSVAGRLGVRLPASPPPGPQRPRGRRPKNAAFLRRKMPLLKPLSMSWSGAPPGTAGNLSLQHTATSTTMQRLQLRHHHSFLHSMTLAHLRALQQPPRAVHTDQDSEHLGLDDNQKDTALLLVVVVVLTRNLTHVFVHLSQWRT